jgi:hypothetical protein
MVGLGDIWDIPTPPQTISFFTFITAILIGFGQSGKPMAMEVLPFILDPNLEKMKAIK